MGKAYLGPIKNITAPSQQAGQLYVNDLPEPVIQYVDKPIYIEKPIYIDVIKEVKVEVPVEKIITLTQEKIVEVPVYINKEIIVEKPIEVIKELHVIRPIKFIPVWIKAGLIVQTIIIVAMLLLK